MQVKVNLDLQVVQLLTTKETKEKYQLESK